jgi:RecA-family ATPase
VNPETSPTERLKCAVSESTYDFTAPRTQRKYDYDGLVVTGVYCLWLGARKAEKSLFALRKAMHDASGRDWFNHKNMIGPAK